MNRKNIKKIVISLFFFLLCAFLVVFIHSLHSPINCKVKKIEIIKYTNSYTLKEDIESIRRAVINNSIESTPQYQYFYGAREFDLEFNTSDFIRVVFTCNIRNNSWKNISQGKIMVRDLPKDDPAFIRAELNDMVVFDHPANKKETICIVMYTKGLTEKEIEAKIKEISLLFIFHSNGKSSSADVLGINSCDISYKEWTLD